MVTNAAIDYIETLDTPDYYTEYYRDLSKLMKYTRIWPSADRVAKMHEIEAISQPIRILLKDHGKESSTLCVNIMPL